MPLHPQVHTPGHNHPYKETSLDPPPFLMDFATATPLWAQSLGYLSTLLLSALQPCGLVTRTAQAPSGVLTGLPLGKEHSAVEAWDVYGDGPRVYPLVYSFTWHLLAHACEGKAPREDQCERKS